MDEQEHDPTCQCINCEMKRVDVEVDDNEQNGMYVRKVKIINYFI